MINVSVDLFITLFPGYIKNRPTALFRRTRSIKLIPLYEWSRCYSVRQRLIIGSCWINKATKEKLIETKCSRCVWYLVDSAPPNRKQKMEGRFLRCFWSPSCIPPPLYANSNLLDCWFLRLLSYTKHRHSESVLDCLCRRKSLAGLHLIGREGMFCILLPC